MLALPRFLWQLRLRRRGIRCVPGAFLEAEEVSARVDIASRAVIRFALLAHYPYNAVLTRFREYIGGVYAASRTR
jgi:hypothetical protein